MDNFNEGNSGPKSQFLVYAAAFLAVMVIFSGGYYLWTKYWSNIIHRQSAQDNYSEAVSSQDNSGNTDSGNASGTASGAEPKAIGLVKESVNGILGFASNVGKYIQNSVSPDNFSWPIEIPGNNHVLISEVMAGEAMGKSASEFVELYNPTDKEISLDGYSLKRINPQSMPQIQILVQSDGFKGKKIAPKNYFLVASPEYKGKGRVAADVFYSGFYRLAYDNDAVFLYDGDQAVDGVRYQNIKPGQSLERKALPEGNYNCVSSLGDGESLGNACDTNTTNDFETRLTPDPKNFKSLPEPKSSVATPQ